MAESLCLGCTQIDDPGGLPRCTLHLELDRLKDELAALKEKIEGVREAHTCIDPRESECDICGALDCPHSEPMHYHHDGCPSCDLEADND